MALDRAHEGYEYQDLLTAFFILKEVLNEHNSSFLIDVKGHANDKFDDLTITNNNGVFKKQIKYSNESTNKTAEKDDFATSNGYDLAFYDLFRSWNNERNNDIRLCLAWNEPTDKLVNFLKVSSKLKTFEAFNTKVFEIDIDKLWMAGAEPNTSWTKFKRESSHINRNDFVLFCDNLAIEMEFPKMGNRKDFSGQLENIILAQIERLGIGEYPNHKTTPIQTAFELLNLITRSRGRGIAISTDDIFRQLNIITDFGSIEQVFPIDEKKNIRTQDAIETFIHFLKEKQRVVLKGEPGSGKSWFVQNLQKALQAQNYKIIKHYCYTELKDTYSKERITLNVFYGNLIKDTIDAFPTMKNEKAQRFASNLSELNALLKRIVEPCVLIIDGLDHIDRVFAFSQTDLTRNDIAIIQAINCLEFSDKVKVVLASQPINALNNLSNYTHFSIPKWKVENVLAYFSKNQVDDIEFSENTPLSTLLTDKSGGNPLYLNYLAEEIKNIYPLSIEFINALPPYSFNLKTYYEYLLQKLNLDAAVPQILSGVHFSLSKSELKDITHQGKYVDKAIDTLKPVLNEKTTVGGYIIYHESFRRFILERLQQNEIEIEEVVFQPVIRWFEKKGFFEFPKAYRFYLQLLYNTGKLDKILDFLKVDFVVESIYYGYSLEAVTNNYQFLAKSAIHQKDLPKIVLANEMNKVLSSTEYEYEQILDLYFVALGHLRGFKTISEYLFFDEKPTLPLKAGLKICYLCSQEPVLWQLYFDYFEAGESIKLEDFKYYVKGILVFKATDKLIDMAERIYSEHIDFIPVFQKELQNHSDQAYITELQDKSNAVSQLIHFKSVIANNNEDLLVLVNQITQITYCSDAELILVEKFFDKIDQNIANQKLINNTIDLLKNKNWFYNWLIYFIKIKSIQNQPNYSYLEVLNAFKYLVYDTEPFKGKPRTSDLYKLDKVIYNAINEGLKYVQESQEWIEIIDLLVKVSCETAVTYKRSLMSAFSIDKLFKLLDENANEKNREKIIQTLVQLVEDKKEYYLHSYIADFYFILSKQFAIHQEIDKANEAFRQGIVFAFGYTHRKDLTLEDAICAIGKYTHLNVFEGKKHFKNLKSLVDSVVQHTDGKETKWFPMDWYKEYLKIDFQEASLYLLFQIKETYYWVSEHQLKDLLIQSDGNTNPLVEAFIFLTFPIDASESFLTYGLRLLDKVEQVDKKIAFMLLQNIVERVGNERNQALKEDFISKYNETLKSYRLDIFQRAVKEKKAIKPFDVKDAIREITSNSVSRKEFSDMTIFELNEYCNTYKLKTVDLSSLYYKFQEFTILTPEIETLITTIIRKHLEYPKDENLNIDSLFEDSKVIATFYWASKFVNEPDGWFKNFMNIHAFKKAYALNPLFTIETLIQLSSNLIIKQGYTRGISSGLINALVTVNYEKEVIDKMWENLYQANDFRLPAKTQIDWAEILRNDLNMDIDEIFIGLLFTRFNANTTERHHWTWAGLTYFYENHPQKMIKPTKWFLQNVKHFLTSNLILILEILDDIHIFNPVYCKPFTEELNLLVPSKYYLINELIGKILGRKVLSIQPIVKIFIPAQQKSVEYFVSLNYRNYILYDYGFDFESIVGRYKSSFSTKDFEFLGNRSINSFVKNVYPANYLIELINEYLRKDFENYYDKAELYEFLKMDYKTIAAQTLSYTTRPVDILRPSQIKNKWERQAVAPKDWIRMGYYEYELFGERFDKNQQIIRTWEGIAFSSFVKETIPFSKYRLYPICLWENTPIQKYDLFACVFLIQQLDGLEDYKILWMNSFLMKKLELTIGKYTEGLCARNKKNEIVLKYNRWSSNYVGNGEIAGITDEIPRLEGGELQCRKDIFEQLCELLRCKKPMVYRLKS